MGAEKHLLFAVLAFESDLLDLAQLTAACRAWSADKSKPLAELLVERGWITAEDRGFVEKQLERKLAKHQHDPRVTLNSVVRGDVCDAIKQVEDADIQQSLSSWPSSGPVLIETIGETLGEPEQPKSRYTWLSEVGKGGLGKVWLARDNDLAREVAIKEVKPGSASTEAVRRLIKEAQITGQLQHPNIVPVYEVHRGGRPFYTMKLVKGETLSKAIRRHHEQLRAGHEDLLSLPRLLNVFVNVCEALAYAHSRGIIHRDLKPENIVLGDYGEAIVLDWGLAKQIGSADEETAPVVLTDDAQSQATRLGTTPGTLAYMSPEQAAGRVDLMDHRTDVYGLGSILFEILTGHAPHRATQPPTPEALDQDKTVIVDAVPRPLLHASLHDRLQRICDGDTPRARDVDPTISRELDAVCATAMAKKRDERYSSAKELKSALLEFQVHKESIDLAASAAANLELARQTGLYDDYSRASFGFEEALRQWPNNTRASDGLREARHAYAETASRHGDYDLALSLLEQSRLVTSARPNDGGECPPSAAHKPTADESALRQTIQLAATERASRQHRIRTLRRFSIAASMTAFAIAVVAAIWINSQKIVLTQTLYAAHMNLAQDSWDEARVGETNRLLDLYRPRDGIGPDSKDLRGFEWFYLDRLCRSELLTMNGAGRFVAFSPDGKRLASAFFGTVTLWDTTSGQEVAVQSVELALPRIGGSVNRVAWMSSSNSNRM